MDKFTITVSEQGGALSVEISGEGNLNGIAGSTALALMRLAHKVIPEAARQAAMAGNCQCEKCKAARAELQAEAPASEKKTTIH